MKLNGDTANPELHVPAGLAFKITLIVTLGISAAACHVKNPVQIDPIIVGDATEQLKIKNSTLHLGQDTRKNKDKLAGISAAVKWQNHSKEYQYITRYIYHDASAQLIKLKKPNMDFVVVMDIDETILDNSPYQVMLDSTKQVYSTTTWNAWVQSEQAKLVPGSGKFIETVIANGGKLALITNRAKSLDKHTWSNLLSVNLPINQHNSCLMGRTSKDIQSIDGIYIVNDKDLRRQQIVNGDADCYSPTAEHLVHWKKAHTILMQVGDNIQDIKGISQETVDAEELFNLLGDVIILLPNPMYGSW